MEEQIDKTFKVDFRELRVKIPNKNIMNKQSWKYAFINDNIKSNAPIEFKIDIILLKFTLWNDDEEGGYLQAFFKPKQWNIIKNGLIYNNPVWIRDFRNALSKYLNIKILRSDIDYSEQGMQGDNYIHMDISSRLIKIIKKI